MRLRSCGTKAPEANIFVLEIWTAGQITADGFGALMTVWLNFLSDAWATDARCGYVGQRQIRSAWVPGYQLFRLTSAFASALQPHDIPKRRIK
jgi:hypothetical protein